MLLGFTSLVTDVSWEMVGAALPLFLTVRLGLSPLQFGTIERTVQLVTALAAVVGALLADRWRRHKEVAAAGCGIGALTKLGLLTATSWGPAAGVRMAADRAGKGIRTAPPGPADHHDAPRQRWGEAFGLHRALDTGGALLDRSSPSPSSAPPLPPMTPSSSPASWWPGGFAVLLVLFVDDPARRTGAPVVPPAWARRRPSARAAALPQCHRRCGRRRVVTASDSFLFLAFRRRSGLEQRWFRSCSSAPRSCTWSPPCRSDVLRPGQCTHVFVIGQLGLVAVYVALSSVARKAGARHRARRARRVLRGDRRRAGRAVQPRRPARPAGQCARCRWSRAGGGARRAAFAFGVSWDRWGPRHTTAVFAVALVVATGVAAWILRHLDQEDASRRRPRVAQVG